MTQANHKIRKFAGVTLPDTPLIDAALDYARTHNDKMSFHHVYRSWIFGAIIASKLTAFAKIDLEVHAISAILHDLAWDYTSPFASLDKRFEIDGANAARDFLKREALDWDDRRYQLVWDSIALHTTASIAKYKEPEVALCNMGIHADFAGPQFPGGVISKDEYNAVIKELPLCNFKDGVKQLFCNLCVHKPGTTYDNFVKDFGIQYVSNYKPPSSAEQLMKPIDH